jgi:hypothetical protein
MNNKKTIDTSYELLILKIIDWAQKNGIEVQKLTKAQIIKAIDSKDLR